MSQIARLAAVAFRTARQQALDLGYRVLYSKDGQLLEVQAGHQERVLRARNTPVAARKGARVMLKDPREAGN